MILHFQLDSRLLCFFVLKYWYVFDYIDFRNAGTGQATIIKILTYYLLTLFLPAMGGISPYMSVTWPSPVGIGLNSLYLQIVSLFSATSDLVSKIKLKQKNLTKLRIHNFKTTVFNAKVKTWHLNSFKGQLILKCLFWCLQFFQKRT